MSKISDELKKVIGEIKAKAIAVHDAIKNSPVIQGLETAKDKVEEFINQAIRFIKR